MHCLSFPYLTSLALFSLAKHTIAFQPCPLLGPRFSIPKSLLASPIIHAALENITAVLDQTVASSNSSNGLTSPNTTSLSVSLFAAGGLNHTDGEPFFFEYHHTAPALSTSSDGVSTVDSNSVYRIGDLTQIFTVWTFLVEAGDSHWNEPVTKYLLELANMAEKFRTQRDPVGYIDWDNILVGELASHMSGIGEVSGSDELLNTKTLVLASDSPISNKDDVPQCGLDRSCTREEFFAKLSRTAPVFAPGTTPVYSNTAFQILSYVLENITNVPFEAMLDRSILHPLNMTSTSLLQSPDATRGVIPINETNSGWSLSFGDESPARSIYTTINDLSKAGAAILTSSLLPPAQTRRWLQPVIQTSNLVNSVGRPWEIYSDTVAITDPVIDTYTKIGNVGVYSSYIGLTPDYNVGFAILSADQHAAADLNTYADIIGELILPALEMTARDEAKAAYTGTYESSDTNQNSSITIVINDEEPGMSVTSLISNGTDIRTAIAKLNNIAPSALDFRVYPTNLHSETGTGSRVAFKAIFQDKEAFADAGTPTCITWMGVDRLKYGSVALDEFVFELDGEGKAMMLEVPALRLSLPKAV